MAKHASVARSDRLKSGPRTLFRFAKQIVPFCGCRTNTKSTTTCTAVLIALGSHVFHPEQVENHVPLEPKLALELRGRTGEHHLHARRWTERQQQ